MTGNQGLNLCLDCGQCIRCQIINRGRGKVDGLDRTGRDIVIIDRTRAEYAGLDAEQPDICAIDLRHLPDRDFPLCVCLLQTSDRY